MVNQKKQLLVALAIVTMPLSESREEKFMYLLFGVFLSLWLYIPEGMMQLRVKLLPI